MRLPNEVAEQPLQWNLILMLPVVVVVDSSSSN